ncbi:hypothetical protein ACS0TY_015923 [Phlomoides rotata]
MSLRPSSRAEVPKEGYKIGVDADEAQRRMEDNLFEIRKNKREDNLLNKKQREGLPNGSFTQQPQLLPLDSSQTPAAIEKKRKVMDANGDFGDQEMDMLNETVNSWLVHTNPMSNWLCS